MIRGSSNMTAFTCAEAVSSRLFPFSINSDDRRTLDTGAVKVCFSVMAEETELSIKLSNKAGIVNFIIFLANVECEHGVRHERS